MSISDFCLLQQKSKRKPPRDVNFALRFEALVEEDDNVRDDLRGTMKTVMEDPENLSYGASASKLSYGNKQGLSLVKRLRISRPTTKNSPLPTKSTSISPHL